MSNITEILKEELRAQRTPTGIRVAFIDDAALRIEQYMESRCLLFAEFVESPLTKENIKEAYNLFKKLP